MALAVRVHGPCVAPESQQEVPTERGERPGPKEPCRWKAHSCPARPRPRRACQRPGPGEVIPGRLPPRQTGLSRAWIPVIYVLLAKGSGAQSVPGGLRIGRLTALQPPAYRWGTTSQSTHHSSVLPPTCPPQYSQPRGSSGASSSLLRDPPPTRGRCSGRKSARSRSLCPLVRGPRGFGKGAGPCTTLERGLRRQMR